MRFKSKLVVAVFEEEEHAEELKNELDEWFSDLKDVKKANAGAI